MNSELTREWRKWHNIIVYETGRPPVHALQTGHLPCSGSEQAILKIAASLAEPGIAISLRDCLGNLDQRNITLVTAAITAANG